ncbi:XRE family transcriptional regulator [Streptomyces sp. NPDC048389]|uniref:XRE family transcriptional regulator n=1 Tax=Streptomyces sp. NPDC048389 TaxID=3154622 RepID=UPI0034526146
MIRSAPQVRPPSREARVFSSTRASTARSCGSSTTSACPSTVWNELVEPARSELSFTGYTNYFFWTPVPHFADTVRRRAGAGCRVRFLLGDPEGEVTCRREMVEDVALSVSTRSRITREHLDRLGPLDGLEARFSHPSDAVSHVSLPVFRFDDNALVTPHRARLVGHDSPLLHLGRHVGNGMFDRFVEHSGELRERARPRPAPGG